VLLLVAVATYTTAFSATDVVVPEFENSLVEVDPAAECKGRTLSSCRLNKWCINDWSGGKAECRAKTCGERGKAECMVTKGISSNKSGCRWATFSKRGFQPRCWPKCAPINNKKDCNAHPQCQWYALTTNPTTKRAKIAKESGAWASKCRLAICGDVTNISTCKSIKNKKGKRSCSWKNKKCSAKKLIKKQWKKERKEDPPLPLKNKPNKYCQDARGLAKTSTCGKDFKYACTKDCKVQCYLLNHPRCDKVKHCKRKNGDRHTKCMNKL